MADVELVQELAGELRLIYPTWTNLEVADLAQITDGWECEVYSFDLKGEDAGEPRREGLILRVYPGNNGAPKAYHEFDVMHWLHRAGFAVPRTMAVSGRKSPIGGPFVIMERIDGDVMGAMMRRADLSQSQQLLALFCGLLVDLHALDWRTLVQNPFAHRAEGYMDRWLAWMEGKLKEFDRPDFLPVLDWLKARSGQVETERLSLTHGDYHPWNILVRGDGKPFVIDWTGADISDYRLDLAWTLVLVRAIMGLPARDAVLAGYERLAGHPVRDVEFFEVAAALKRLASIVVSIAQGPEKLGMRAGAAATMQDQKVHLSTAYAIVREQTSLTLPAVEAML